MTDREREREREAERKRGETVRETKRERRRRQTDRGTGRQTENKGVTVHSSHYHPGEMKHKHEAERFLTKRLFSSRCLNVRNEITIPLHEVDTQTPSINPYTLRRIHTIILIYNTQIKITPHFQHAHSTHHAFDTHTVHTLSTHTAHTTPSTPQYTPHRSYDQPDPTTSIFTPCPRPQVRTLP